MARSILQVVNCRALTFVNDNDIWKLVFILIFYGKSSQKFEFVQVENHLFQNFTICLTQKKYEQFFVNI